MTLGTYHSSTLKKKSSIHSLAEEEEGKIMEEEEMSTTTSFLSQEIVMEILSRLPAKSMVSSFKLVCKPWRTLIQDPDFIKMHLTRGGGASSINGGGERRISSSNNHSLICKSGNELFQLYPPFIFEGLPTEAAKMLDFDLDLGLSSPRSRLVGSCNGLLCLSVVNDDENIILLNLSTRKCKISSPKKPNERGPRFKPYKPTTYGFGCYYNSTTNIDEYKVVRIVHVYRCKILKVEIDIYSMSSNSWKSLRRVEGISCDISEEGFGLFLNEAVHWMGCKLPYSIVWCWNTIVSFNIRDEELRQVPMPPCVDVDVVVNDNDEYPYLNDSTILMNVRGCLGNAYFPRTKTMDIELQIWVMKEYGIRESWTKEFVIKSSISDPPRELYAFPIWLRSMTCFLAGDQILIDVRVRAEHEIKLYDSITRSKDYKSRVLYDMNKKKIEGDFRMVDMPYEQYKDDLVDYIETLVSLKSSLLPSSNN